MNKTRILLVDDHEMVRVGLRTLLSRHDSIEVVGEANSVETARAAILATQPDLILLDVRLPDGSGFDLCEFVHTLPHSPKILILTSFADKKVILSAMSAGADGYLLKEIDSNALRDAIVRVMTGQSILDPSITQTVMEALRDRQKNPAKGKDLSPQEMKVLALVAEGKTNKEIGAALQLSEKTVKNYFSNILDKLDLARRSQAAAFYVSNFSSGS